MEIAMIEDVMDKMGELLQIGFGEARPSLIPSLCTHFTRAGIEWRR